MGMNSMSKFTIAVRVLLLAALIILFVAIIWGVTHRTSVESDSIIVNHFEELKPEGSGAPTAIFLSVMVVLGIGVVGASLVFKL
ncbi:MAG: hypothetical protein ACYC55_05585 [Candidatus Geothermincolia bacterium]